MSFWKPSVRPLPTTHHGSLISHYAFEPQATGLRRRRLLVYLPPGYKPENARRYPVLYLLDGQNVFDLSSARSGGWKVEASLDRLLEEGAIRPAILVAVFHSDQRLREYCGWSEDPDYSHRLGPHHAAYLAEVVKPYIDQTYKTMPGRRHTGVAGASAGGVAAVYAGLTYPRVFGAVGCMSAGRHFFSEIQRRFLAPGKNLRVFLSCGTEGMDTEFLPQTRLFRQALSRRGLQVELRVGRGEAHDEKAWSRMVPFLLKFMFARQ